MDLEDTSNTEGIRDREERQHDEEAEMLVEDTEQEEKLPGTLKSIRAKDTFRKALQEHASGESLLQGGSVKVKCGEGWGVTSK